MHLPPARLTCTLITLIALLLGCVASPAFARDRVDGSEPELALPARWYQIVQPYRYVEARRFERGWSRGAGVRVIGRSVRTPVSGTVRFTGPVAGRHVTTIDARIDGHPVVVTFTGARPRGLVAGTRVRRGDVLGVGARVHIGVYDPTRRTRYLPVRAAQSVPAAGATGTGDATISGAITRRLIDAVNGAIPSPSSALLGLAAGAAGASGRADAGGTPDGSPPRPGRGAALRSAQRSGSHADREAGSLANHAPDVHRMLTNNEPERTVSAPRGQQRSRHPAPSVVGTLGTGDPGRAATLTHQQQPHGFDEPSVRAGDSELAGFRAGRPPDPSRRGAHAPSNLPADQRASTHSRGSVQGASQQEPVAPWAEPLPRSGRSNARRYVPPLVLALVAGLLAWHHRRRRMRERGTSEGVNELVPALPIIVPHVQPYAYPVVHTDGSSILPDIGLAWSTHDPGSDEPTDPAVPRPPRANACAPEHA